MNRLRVNASSKSYDILIENGALSSCGEYIRSVCPNSRKVMLVTDSNVMPLYEAAARRSIEGAGYECHTFCFEAGEQSKNLDTIGKMVNFAAEHRLTRHDVVAALGGGVTGDMAGFTAAIYMRGIKCVQIPTTLLSQVDSSVGGKTGVDLPSGKNLVGAFLQPSVVIIDPTVLSTLPAHFFADGMGEVIKYGCIKSRELFDSLSGNVGVGAMNDIIYKCVDIKRRVVEADETEQGERMLLNFGHTLGHSVERAMKYTGITHGEAVGVGMLMITRISEAHSLTAKGAADKIEAMLKRFSMPTTTEVPFADILSGIMSDKKRTGDHVNFVLLRDIGDSFIYRVKNSDLNDFLKI